MWTSSLPTRRKVVFLWALALSFTAIGGSSVVAQDEEPLDALVASVPRAGLPNFRAKVEAGQSLKVAYLGGSITAAPGWRVQSREWLAGKYPDAKFEEINAAIGGTGSDLGVFRLYNDVLRHDPDLLFVEFAVNDGGASPVQIQKAMEGIVRQTWRTMPDCDICFVYTLSEPMLPLLRSGKMQKSASAMEVVADYYQIPSINFAHMIVGLEQGGELVFKAPRPENIKEARPFVFSTDGVHPHAETGHVLYTRSIQLAWPALWNARENPAPHKLSEPLRRDNWEAAQQVPITPAMLRGSWKQLSEDNTQAKRFQRNMPELWQAEAAEAALEFTFDGTTAAIFDLVGPDGGEVTVTLDDREQVTRNRIDGYCTYHRMSKLPVASELPTGRHHVRIELTPTMLDKRNILFEQNRADLDQHPDKYAATTWYAGSILVIGQIVTDNELPSR